MSSEISDFCLSMVGFANVHSGSQPTSAMAEKSKGKNPPGI
jgi:hypothetical protein